MKAKRLLHTKSEERSFISENLQEVPRHVLVFLLPTRHAEEMVNTLSSNNNSRAYSAFAGASGTGSASSSSMSLTMDLGAVGGPYRFTGTPFRSQRNLVKFHLMDEPRTPPPIRAFKNRNTGWAPLPFTSIFSNISNFTVYCWTNWQMVSSS